MSLRGEKLKFKNMDKPRKKRPRVVLGVTGSIAAFKAPELVRLLREKGFDVSCLLTEEAAHFVSPLVLSTFTGKPALTDMFSQESQGMPHLRSAEEADLYLVAPVTANVLARCAQGLADDLVSLTYLATGAPVVMAPAMHNTMWHHPATQANVRLLKERGVTFVGPIVGKLADGTTAEGRMSELKNIVGAVESMLEKKRR